VKSATQRYAEAVWPDRWTVFGLRLKPFSLGHALLFRRLDLDDRDWSEILQAVWLCSMDWRKASEAALRDLPLRGRLWLHRKLLHAALRPRWAIEHNLAWVEYQRAAYDCPDLWLKRSAKSKQGPPELLQIKLLLQEKLGYTSESAKSLPFSQALWECAAWTSGQGGFEFVTDDDQGLMESARKLRQEFEAEAASASDN